MRKKITYSRGQLGFFTAGIISGTIGMANLVSSIPSFVFTLQMNQTLSDAISEHCSNGTQLANSTLCAVLGDALTSTSSESINLILRTMGSWTGFCTFGIGLFFFSKYYFKPEEQEESDSTPLIQRK